MNALATRHSHALVTPTVHERAHQLMDLSLYRSALNLDPRHPDRPTLERMAVELRQALTPCSGQEAIAAAATLIEAYPQADKTSGTYAQLLAQRLAGVPSDLLPRVMDRILDDNPDFRPAPGAVTRSVQAVVGKRTMLLRQVEAAIGWMAQHAVDVAEAAIIAAERAAFAALPPEERTARIAIRATTAMEIVPIRPAHLTPDQLARAREAAKAQV